MNHNDLKQIKFYTPRNSLKKIFCEKPFSIFSIKTIKLFTTISENIFNLKNLNKFPDLATFAFFCRKKNLTKLQNEYSKDLKSRSGRGLALQFTPSNVPLNFAYSLFFSLITGNVTVIRIGDNKYEQSKILLKILNKVLNKKKFFFFKNKILIINYPKNKSINNLLSKNCQIRILWGGDKSIEQIRESKLNADAYELTFPNRNSICIISSKKYLQFSNYRQEALNFYNDTLTFDQNACTSPKLIVWIGSKKINQIARKVFWKNFYEIVYKKNYFFNEKMAIDKVTAQFAAAISLDGMNKNNFKVKNKYIKNSLIKIFPKDFSNYTAAGGFFLELDYKKIDLLKKNITTKIQTITTIGFSNLEIKRKLQLDQSKGVFRIVQNGMSSDMGLIWDGYEIVYQMSKKIIF